MAFNSLTIRLTAECLHHLPDSPSIVELGNQTFKPSSGTLDEIHAFMKRSSLNWNENEFIEVKKTSQSSKSEFSPENYLMSIGYKDYTCIDINKRYNALLMDLNQNLNSHYNFKQKFDLTTNRGTGEHVLDRKSVV